MFRCPKCEGIIDEVISKKCPHCELYIFNEAYTTWIGSSGVCDIVIQKDGIPPIVAAICYDPDKNIYEIINIHEGNDNLLVNRRLVRKKTQITIDDWLKIENIILDFNHPNISPLFSANKKVSYTIDFNSIEEYIVGNTENSHISFNELDYEAEFVKILNCNGDHLCCYPENTFDDRNKFHPIFINEFKLNYGDIKLIDENDQVFIENFQLDLKVIPSFNIESETYTTSQKFPLEFNFDKFNKDVITIGLSNCDIVLISEKISYQHLQIKRYSKKNYWLKDLNSDFGTYIQNIKVDECELHIGEYVIFGDFRLILFEKDDAVFIQIEHSTGKISLDAISLNKTVIEYTFPVMWEQTKLLDDISISIKAGELVAIMGPSGAGKSTVLKMLAGIDPIDQKSTTGSIRYNNIDITKNPNHFKFSYAYLPQDDILFPDLTVYECLYYVAKLRLPHLSKNEINILIDEVLISLDMAEKTDIDTFYFPLKNKKIGDVNKAGALSGGQRKRINLAVELLSDPAILFLDEPTSGLSSTGSDKLINQLVKLCNMGNTIVTSIHQPSRQIFNKFNKILILTKHGKVAYFGSVTRALDYFQRRSELRYDNRTNPAVYIMDVLDTKPPDFWQQEYITSEAYEYYVHHHQKKLKESSVSRKKTREKNQEKIPNISQIITLTKRNFKLKFNNIVSLMLLIFQAPIIAFFVGLIFSGVIQDGSLLDEFKPEEEFFRLENYARPKTARYLPPFSKDVKIENLTDGPLYLYTQADKILEPDTAYFRKIGPYLISRQIMYQGDDYYFPLKAGNYKLVISDSILDDQDIRKSLKLSRENKSNTYYYMMNIDDEQFAVNDWDELSKEEKIYLWKNKILEDRKDKVERESYLFEDYKLLDSNGILSSLNYVFDKYYPFSEIKKYYYTVDNDAYSWFDATYQKKTIFTGSFGYKEDSQKLLYLVFIMILSFIWIGMTNSVKDVVMERQIFRREHRYTLKIPNYIASKFITLLLISIFQIITFLIVLFSFIPVLPANMPTVFLILLLTAIVAGGIGLFISSLASTIEFAIFALPLILIPQIIFAGIFKHIGAMSNFLREISAWTISRWSLESMVNAISRAVDFESPFHNFIVPYNNIIYPCYYPTTQGDVLLQNGYFPYVLEMDILILTTFAAMTFCTSSLILYAKTKFVKK